MSENNSYQGDVELYPPALEALETTDFERLVYLEELNPILLLSFQKHVMKTLEILLHTSNQDGQSYRLVTGFTGTGKSTLFKAFLEKHPPIDLDLGIKSRPVLYVVTPPAASGHLLCAEILRQAGVWTPMVRKNENLLPHVVTALRAQNVKILIIDEMQHANLAKAGPMTGALLDAIKYLGEVLDISIVCGGTYSISTMMLMEDPPLERRFGQPLEIPLLDRSRTLPGFVKGIQRALPLRKHRDLCTDEMLDLIANTVNMTSDSVVRLLKTAANWAIETGEERITKKLIKKIEWQKMPLDDNESWTQRHSRR